MIKKNINHAIRSKLGPLLLTTLDSVSLRHAQTLESIGALCPFLRHVTFDESMPVYLEEHLNGLHITAPFQLRVILGNWPAVSIKIAYSYFIVFILY